MKHKPLPPEGLWISPDGKQIPVTEHLLALQHHPEQFGLPASTRRADIPVLRKLAEGLIRDGWVRFRCLASTYAFEVDNARRRWRTMVDIVMLWNPLPDEIVTVSQACPIREFRGSPSTFLLRDMFKHRLSARRNHWRFTMRKGPRHG